MERTIFYDEKNMENMMLRYYIVIQNIGDEKIGLESYGVLVEKTVIYAGGGKSVESKQINNIFYKKSDIEEFMALISRNTVTPFSLAEVLDDFIQVSLQCIK